MGFKHIATDSYIREGTNVKIYEKKNRHYESVQNNI